MKLPTAEDLKKELDIANKRIAQLEKNSRINYMALKLLLVAGYVSEDRMRQAQELAEGAEK